MSASDSDQHERLREALGLARYLDADGNLRQAFDLLDQALESFSATEGPHIALISPLMFSAELIHTLGDAIEAHARIDRALSVADSRSEAASLFHADVLCLAGLAERVAMCDRAVDFYERGLDEGMKLGASEEWQVQRLVGMVSALLALRPRSKATLTYAVRGAGLALRTYPPDGPFVFVTKFNLACARLEAGMNREAAELFEDLLTTRQGRGPNRVGELRELLARANGGK
jgi:tetratricopeptide (TPR) repeat protein